MTAEGDDVIVHGQKPLWIVFFLSVGLGGLDQLLLVRSRIAEILPWLPWANPGVFVLSSASYMLMVLLGRISKRAVFDFLLRTCVGAALGWYVFLLGWSSWVEYILPQAKLVAAVPLATGAALIALFALLEWRFVPWYWRDCVKRRRIDLDSGLYRPSVPRPSLSEFWPPLGSSAGGGCLVVAPVCGLILSRLLPHQTGAIVTCIFSTVGVVLFVGLAYAMGLSPAVRIVIWEIRTGRALRFEWAEPAAPGAAP